MTDKKYPRRNLYIQPEDWEALKKLGSGNASAGIREALKQSQERKA